MIKKLINNTLRKMGYEINHLNTIERRILKGEFKWLQEYGINTVLDIGANVGNFSLMINKILNDASIYAFEPLEICYKDLLNNTKHIKNLKYFNIGLGRQPEEMDIYQNEFSPSSSLLKMNELHKNAFPHTKKSVQIKIKIDCLDNLHKNIDWKKKVLLKIDVQGYELEVLKGAVSSLSVVDVIIIETSFAELYQNQPLFDSIYEFLRSKDFRYEGNLNQFKDTRSGRILQSDSIFIRI